MGKDIIHKSSFTGNGLPPAWIDSFVNKWQALEVQANYVLFFFCKDGIVSVRVYSQQFRRWLFFEKGRLVSLQDVQDIHGSDRNYL